VVQFNVGHFANHLWGAVVRNRLRPRELRVGAEGSHKCSPGEFAGRQRAKYAVRRRVKSFDIGNVGCDFSLQKVSDLLIQSGSLNLWRVGVRLCERITMHEENSGES